MDIANETLENRIVLEVGSGRGDTTRELADLLSQHPGNILIVTDISDAFFHSLREALAEKAVKIRFIQTDACELEGIKEDSIDFIVCNYTLCAVNARTGSATVALNRFWEVLQPGGMVFIEEEYPTDKASGPPQEIWAEKWRILKSVTLLTGGFPYTEFAPEILSALCRIVGFESVEWTPGVTRLQGAEVLDFFEARLLRLLSLIPNESFRQGYQQAVADLRARALEAGGMEIPYYRLSASKRANEPEHSRRVVRRTDGP